MTTIAALMGPPFPRTDFLEFVCVAQLLYLWLNEQLGRPQLAFADLLGW
jgi:hypothetical protein